MTPNFITEIIDEHNRSGRFGGKVVTRFPPEPNGFLHIGHAQAIWLNFSLAQAYNGRTHLRFDDTNPEKETEEFMQAIQEDVRWLGYDWGEHLYYASDYFERLHDCAVELIRAGKAYVCSLKGEEVRAYRGTLTEAGKNSPYRDRSVEENLDLFARMRNGEFENGEHALRAKIDMSSGNINLRDPTLYRIRHMHHMRTGDQWCIYPLYDFTHGLSDSFEGVTQSICTLEFQDHRPLYDWILDELGCESHPQQIEFARLNVNYTVMSKRKLKRLVDEGVVSGWDDPRMPTIRGLRRRGYPAAALRKFCATVGVNRRDAVIDVGVLEQCVREELNESAPRAFGVLDPLKLVITTYPEDQVEEFDAPLHPQKEEMGTRKMPFSREVYIERADFMEDAPKKFFRLAPGREVRLRYGYVIKCEQVIKDEQGRVVELRCSHDPDTLGKNPEGRKVKGIIHWVSAKGGIKAQVNVYDRLFKEPTPLALEKQGRDFMEAVNEESLQVLRACVLEPSLAAAKPEQVFQFERLGYFCADWQDHSAHAPVFNRVVTLRDTWAKVNK